MILGGNTPEPIPVAIISKTTGKLTDSVNINGVPFDGSASITVPAVDTATPRIAGSEKGAENGVAPLGSDSKVAAVYLPAYVDDVVEFANLAAFPGTGTSGVIYVALDTGKIYRWSGSSYIEISPSPGSTDSVTEGAANLYFTNARALAAAPAETTTTEGALVSGATEKTTPVDADVVGISDSAAGGVLKKLSWSNIKATLKSYFDTLYPAQSSGSWTPIVAGLTVAGTPTYTGKYTKTGKVVRGTLSVASTGSTSSTGWSTTFTGLPFTVNGNGSDVTVTDGGLAVLGAGVAGNGNIIYPCGWTAQAFVLINFSYETND